MVKTGWILAAALTFLGCGLMMLTVLPVEYAESVIQLKGNLEGFPASPLKDRQVKLRLPLELVSGSPIAVEITLLPEEIGGKPQPVEVRFVEGRLDLPDVDIFPAETIQAPYLPGKTVSYRWLVTANESTSVAGRAWLSLDMSSAFGEDTLTPVLARPIELAVRTFFGLSSPTARWLGGGMIGLGLVFTCLSLLRRKRK
jgi:hypothetical protein